MLDSQSILGKVGRLLGCPFGQLVHANKSNSNRTIEWLKPFGDIVNIGDHCLRWHMGAIISLRTQLVRQDDGGYQEDHQETYDNAPP